MRNKLSDYPSILAFMAVSATKIIGKEYSYWANFLSDYGIGQKCGCGWCVTFDLISPASSGNYVYTYMGHFDDYVIIFHTNNNGVFTKFEIPELILDLPFKNDYDNLENEQYHSQIALDEAKQMAQAWFDTHPQTPATVVYVDD